MDAERATHYGAARSPMPYLARPRLNATCHALPHPDSISLSDEGGQ